jgi:hypothetical protein
MLKLLRSPCPSPLRDKSSAPVRAGFWILWVGLGLCAPAKAAAQSPSFVVVGAHHAALSDGAVPVDAVEQSVRLGSAAPLSGAEGRARFIASHSDEPAIITPSDVAALERCYHDAGMSLARGRVQAAGEQVQRCIDRANEVRETLVRDASGAQSFLRACAVQVQYFLSSGRGEDALRQATECRLVASDIPLSARSAPPEVRAIFDAADHALAELEPATIEVRSTPQTGCSVWLRGQNVGTTPAVVPGLLPGRADLQVECVAGQAGRVHRADFRSGRNLITIDTRFEDVIRTEGRVRLVYSEPADVEAHRVEDAVTVGRAIGVADVLLVTLDDERAAAVLERVDTQRGAVRARATVSLRGGRLDEEELAAARIALENAPRPEPVVARAELRRAAPRRVAAPRSGQGGATPALDAERREPAPDASAEGGVPVLGIVLTAAGVAGIAGGWALFANSRSELDRLNVALPSDPDYAQRQDDYDSSRVTVYALGAPGGALLTLAIPFLLPTSDGVPSWAYAAGGLGLVGAGLAAWQWAIDGSCLGSACERRDLTFDRGSLLGLSALPLLAIPLTYAVRSLARTDDVHAEVRADSSGVTLTVGGAL